MTCIYGIPKSVESSIPVLKENNVTAICCNDPDKGFLLKDAGFEIFRTVGAFSAEPDDGTGSLCINVYGENFDWFGSNCPNSPGAKDRHIKRVLDTLSDGVCDTVFTDGCRFPSPGSGLIGSLGCFCPNCISEAKKLGYDLELSRQHILDLITILSDAPLYTYEDNGKLLQEKANNLKGVKDMFSFRRTVITQHMGSLKKTVKELYPESKIAMYIFTPAYAFLVGQDYRALADGIVDIFSPMIYRIREKNGIACLTHETEQIVSDISVLSKACRDDVCKTILSMFFPGSAEIDRGIEVLNGFLPETVGTETKSARRMVGDKPLMPIVWLEDDKLSETLSICRDNGADDIILFHYDTTKKDKYIKMSK